MSFILKVLKRSEASEETNKRRASWLHSKGLTKSNYKDLLKHVNTMVGNPTSSVNGRLTRAFHVLGFVRELIDDEKIDPEVVKQYESIVNELKQKQVGIRVNNTKDPNFVSLEELKSKLNLIKPTLPVKTKADYKALEAYILVSLYVNTPAVRNDFYRLIITNRESNAGYKGNFISINQQNCKLVLNDYKTSDTFGRAVLDVDKHTASMIRKLLIGRKKLNFESPYLFAHIEKDGTFTELTSPVTILMRLKKASQEYFGKPYSVDVYRRAWETFIQAQPSYATMTIKQRAAEHAKLLHGTRIAMEYNRV